MSPWRKYSYWLLFQFFFFFCDFLLFSHLCFVQYFIPATSIDQILLVRFVFAAAVKSWLLPCVTRSACCPGCVAQTFCMVRQNYRDHPYDCSLSSSGVVSFFLSSLNAPTCPNFLFDSSSVLQPSAALSQRQKVFPFSIWEIASILHQTSCRHPPVLGQIIQLHMGIILDWPLNFFFPMFLMFVCVRCCGPFNPPLFSIH